MKTKTLTSPFKRIFFILFTILSVSISAQEEAKEEKKETAEKKWFDNFSISGSVDGYYRYNFGAPNDNSVAPGTSFANQSGFALGMANTIISYEGEKTGFVADLVYGQRGEDAVFNSDGSAQIVNQLYAYWNVTDSFKLTIGNFNTYLGYEVISPTGNFNYSTSYMFSYGPFSHTGLKADFADTYIIGAQVGYAVDNGSAYLNFRYGNEGEPGDVGPLFQVDLTTGWDITSKFYLGINGTYVSQEDQGEGDPAGFYGIALYPQIKATDNFSIGLRGEYFAVYNGALNAVGLNADDDGSVFAATLTGSYDVGSLTFKPELRLDSTAENTFTNNDGEATKSLASFVLGAVYSF